MIAADPDRDRQPAAYRFRPLGMDPHKALFDLLLLAPLPPGSQRPEPYQAVRIGVEDSYQERRIRHMHQTLDKYLSGTGRSG